LYYLQTRYYDPETGRFINADGLVSTPTGLLGGNMFAYCNNNPVNYSDSNGMCKKTANGMVYEFCLFASNCFKKSTTPKSTFLGTNSSSEKVTISPKKQEPSATIFKGKGISGSVYVSINNKDKVPSKYGDVHLKVTIDPKNLNSNGMLDPNISIVGSHLLTDRYDQEMAMDIIMRSKFFDSTIFTKSKQKYISEWRGHNALYSIGINVENSITTDLNVHNNYPWDVFF